MRHAMDATPERFDLDSLHWMSVTPRARAHGSQQTAHDVDSSDGAGGLGLDDRRHSLQPEAEPGVRDRDEPAAVGVE